MKKVPHRNNLLTSDTTRAKWVDNFVKIHSRKQQIVDSQNQNIEVRVANFQEMLRMNISNKKQKKKYSKSTSEIGCILAQTLKGYFRKSQTRDNSLHQESEAQRDKDSEEAQIKKFNRMALGLEAYEDQCKQKGRALQRQIEHINKKPQNYQNLQSEEVQYRRSGNIHTASPFENMSPFPTGLAKTQKGWHQMKRIQLKMQEKNIFLPINVHTSQNRFKGLKKTVKDLQAKAKTLYGLQFIRNTPKDNSYTREMTQLKKKQKELNQMFLNSKQSTDNIQHFLQHTDIRKEDESVPKFLFQTKPVKLFSRKFFATRVQSSNLQRSYVRIL